MNRENGGKIKLKLTVTAGRQVGAGNSGGREGGCAVPMREEGNQASGEKWRGVFYLLYIE